MVCVRACGISISDPISGVQLEQKAHMKEEALKKSELMLEEASSSSSSVYCRRTLALRARVCARNCAAAPLAHAPPPPPRRMRSGSTRS